MHLLRVWSVRLTAGEATHLPCLAAHGARHMLQYNVFCTIEHVIRF